MTKVIAAAILATAAIAAPAHAGVAVVVGDTTSSPTFNRPVGGTPPTGLSGIGTAARYAVTQFQVGSTGAYTLGLTSAFDNFLILYSGSFDAASPLSNALDADDDDGTGLNAALTANLTTGVNYFAVATGFGNSDFGAYTLTISGQGDILLSRGGAVPEPATWAMLILGFGLVGGAMRSGKTTVAVRYT